jgi:hypothetical protein
MGESLARATTRPTIAPTTIESRLTRTVTSKPCNRNGRYLKNALKSQT